ncbi:MAG: methyltransferase domain-containing protein [Gammaproteobacteria bacterium]|nr:methyltransferase domain-containing protein [Gammaproteobacteria bacterium]
MADIRSALGTNVGPMNYLLDRVRRDMEERMLKVENLPSSGLVIDFKNGDLQFDFLSDRKDDSLLESCPRLFPYLKSYETASTDLVVINLQMAWLDFEALLKEAKRVLRPSGMLFFSTLGPDTLGELSYAWGKVDELAHVHPFVDMHFIGDTLVKLGMSKPIVDTDWLTVEYPNTEVLLDDLKQEGFANVLSTRRKTLTGKTRFKMFKKSLWEMCGKSGVLPVSFEIVFGFAQVSENEFAVHVRPPELPEK